MILRGLFFHNDRRILGLAIACFVTFTVIISGFGSSLPALAEAEESTTLAAGDVSTESSASDESQLEKSSLGIVPASVNGLASSGSNRYLAWTDYTTDNGNSEVFFRRSTNNGATWKPVVNLSNNPGQSANVAIAASGRNIYVVWEQYNLSTSLADVFVRASTDGGASWGNKIKLTFTGNNIGVFPQVAAFGDKAYVVWGEENKEIITKRSIDAGLSWVDEANLSDNDGDSKFPQIAASGSNVYVVWQDSSGNDYDVLFARSTNSGKDWQPEVDLSDNEGNSFLPRIAISTDKLFVVWTDVASGKGEIMFKRSTDSGATWKVARNLSQNPGHSVNPHLATTGSNVYVTWEQDDSPFTSTDVFFRASTNNGGVWGSKVRLTQDGDNQGALPQVAGSGSRVFVAWAEGVNSILIKTSEDKGVTWGSAKKLSRDLGTSATVYLAVSGLNVSVVWEYTIDTTDVMFRRSADGGATWKSIVNISNNSGNSYLTESVPPNYDVIG